ncbi:hypothetical protein CHS0354_039191 [Potamilus streckersoni]|uniref:Uncharacterized protein n=1 Tax=Potamilus streckersoni TaxID=2493646 RepID=A0AAE0TEI5_9BIVA|nr:hypothetical protein CHS0354_039191 [Potamilus streckersoni]
MEKKSFYEGGGETSITAPLLPEHVAQRDPPPSYSEVMGEYQTSVAAQHPPQDMPALAYIDIMPRCINPGNIPGGISPTFDTFSTIIYGANSWLMNNKGLCVWKCETIQRKIKKEAYGLSYSLESMFDHQPAFGTDYHVLGLRMWLTKKPDPKSPPQQLGILNVVPDKESIRLPANPVGFGPYGFFQYRGMFIHPMQMAMGLHFTFAGLKETIEKLNQMLEQDPIPGTILNVETAAIKAFETFNVGNNTIDPEDTLVRINKEKFTRYTQVIRVYYVQGKSAQEQIGMQEFLPEMTEAPDMMKRAKFSNTTETLTRIATWLKHQQGLRVVNIQQFDVRSETFPGMFGTSSNSTDNFESCWDDRRMLKTFRVFFTRSKVMPAPVSPPFLTSRIFVPFRTGHRSFETMTQTMNRINAWMKLTGLPIFSVETTRLPYVAHEYQGVSLDRSDYLLSSRSGGYWVNCIRVYFPNFFQEPDPIYFSMPQDWRSQTESVSCSIL